MKRNRQTLVAAWVGALVLPVYLLYVSFTFDLFGFINLMFLEDRQTTTGTVVSHHGYQGQVTRRVARLSSSSRSPLVTVDAWLYSPVVRFALPDGEHVEFTDGTSSTQKMYAVGEQVTVVYSATFPGAALIHHPVQWPGGAIGFGAAALLSALSAGFLARRRREPAVIAHAGAPIPGDASKSALKSAMVVMFFLLVALFFVYAAVTWLSPLIDEGYAQGTVVAHLDPRDGQDARDRDVPAVEQVVVFTGPDGREITFRTVAMPIADATPVDGTVGVVYDVNSPWDAKIGEWSLFGLGWIEITGLAVILVLLGGYIVRRKSGDIRQLSRTAE